MITHKNLSLVLALATLATWQVPPASADDKTDCDNYANRAVAQYNQMTSHANSTKAPRCQVKDSPRWQPNFSNHYDWCMTNVAAHREWLASESGARQVHLANDCIGPK